MRVLDAWMLSDALVKSVQLSSGDSIAQGNECATSICEWFAMCVV